MIKSFSKFSNEKIFVIFAVIFGFLYLVITPPFQSVDEHFHFFRACGIAQNQFLAEKQDNGIGLVYIGNKLPKSVMELTVKFSRLIKNQNEKTSINELKEASKITLNPDNKVFANFPNTALYSPVPYFAQTAGIKTAEILKMNPFWFIYFGRIFNLILYCILGYWAIKTIPILKSSAFLILLSPMALSLGASLSADVTIIGASLLFFAFILKSVCSDKELNGKTIIFFICYGSCISNIKT